MTHGGQTYASKGATFVPNLVAQKWKIAPHHADENGCNLEHFDCSFNSLLGSTLPSLIAVKRGALGPFGNRKTVEKSSKTIKKPKKI